MVAKQSETKKRQPRRSAAVVGKIKKDKKAKELKRIKKAKELKRIKKAKEIQVDASEIAVLPGHDYIIKTESGYTPFYKVGSNPSHRIKCNKWKSPEKLDETSLERQRRYTLKRIRTGLKKPYARGSKDEVFLGLALKTAGGVTRDGLIVNSKGRVVNLGRHTAGRTRIETE